MKIILFLLPIIFFFAPTAYSYPKSQMEDCISSSLKNPATKSIPKSSITKYCDCALKAIFDENKDIRESGYKCAQKNFS